MLARLADYRPDLAEAIAALAEPAAAAAAEPPPPTDLSIGAADSVESFLTLLYGLPAAGEKKVSCAGMKTAALSLHHRCFDDATMDLGNFCRARNVFARRC